MPRSASARNKRALAFLRQHGLAAKSNPLHFCRGISLTARVFMGRLEDGQQTGGHTRTNMTYERYLQGKRPAGVLLGVDDRAR